MTPPSITADAKVRVLGVDFHTAGLEPAIARLLQGGLLVAPSGPGLAVDLVQSAAYRKALLAADVAITDSGWMVLLWLARTGRRLPRLSGLKLLRALLLRDDLKPAGTIFWVMPDAAAAAQNRAWLDAAGFVTPVSATYIAPHYGPGEITDPALLAALEAQRPRLIMLCLGGGVQERVGLMLKERLGYRPGIACLGAAIAFLTGGQTRIPVWADTFFLGWACRLARDPRRFWKRYWSALRLAPLILRYRDRLPVAS